MFHADKRHSPHWSEDFVEHIRTVHFSLVAVCLALIGLLQFEKPRDVKTAQSQLQEIKAAVDAWDSQQVSGTVRDAFFNAGGGFATGPFTGFEIFQHNLMITDSPLIWVPSEKAGRGEAVSQSDFMRDKIMKKPVSLADFRDFWNLLNRRPQVWSVDREHLSDKLVIVNNGSASLVNYRLGPLTSGETLDATLSDEQQRRIVSDALHIAAPECVYSFVKGEGTMLLPVAIRSKKEFDGQAALIATHPYWKTGVFSKSFLELEAATAGKQSNSFESIASGLADEAAKTQVRLLRDIWCEVPCRVG
jgi:hypothetical protein